jgi:hypothetical protein
LEIVKSYTGVALVFSLEGLNGVSYMITATCMHMHGKELKENNGQGGWET